MAKIERFIGEHRDNPARLQKLCEDTGLALRTVGSIIRGRLGVSAHAYLARRRPAFVRQHLLNPNEATTVTRAAMHFGFPHLGRFSDFYHQICGELPFTTLRRTLGRSPNESDEKTPLQSSDALLDGALSTMTACRLAGGARLDWAWRRELLI